MAVVLVILSASITALTNLLIRRGLDVTKGATGDPFIIHRFVTAALFMLAVIFIRHAQLVLDFRMFAVGACAGLALGLLQYTQGRSLNYGPPGLSFIVVSCACVIPPILMYLVFGEPFGRNYTLYNLIGSLLVIAGLLWMATKSTMAAPAGDRSRWLFWVSLAFCGGILYQLVLEWRALLLKEGLPESPLVPFHSSQIEGECFIIAMFLTAALCQLFYGTSTAKQAPRKQVLICGIVGGVLNAVSGFLLVLSTEAATTDIEKAIIFPLNTVLLLSLCNVWASLLYKEKVNWPANALSMAGIVVGSR